MKFLTVESSRVREIANSDESRGKQWKAVPECPVIAHNIPHGDWFPAGRRAGDGVIPEQYCLRETPGRHYQQRTKWNVRDSGATLIHAGAELTGDRYSRWNGP